MKSLVLVPYCPWPPDTGTRVEMMKHLDVLKDLGECTIVSARQKPVGFGWDEKSINVLKERGFSLLFRETSQRFTVLNILGSLYALVCKSLKLDKAFGHSNPYHRWAFSRKWLNSLSKGYDLCCMHYGFWSDFDVQCPKAVVVHELLSNYHWENYSKEVKDFKKSNLIIVVGHDEEVTLRKRGLTSVLWSPPAVKCNQYPVNAKVGLIGTKAPQNLDGLRWLEQAENYGTLRIHVFGNLADELKKPNFEPVGRYGAQSEPYAKCGILLLTRPDRPGLQIKAVEALAYGRVIIARKGSMRGLPEGKDAWITVETPEEMIQVAKRLEMNPKEREQLAIRSREYYMKYLNYDLIIQELREAYLSLLK
ncbi:MAG: glycosyltransferase [Pseudomonadota bacterium]